MFRSCPRVVKFTLEINGRVPSGRSRGRRMSRVSAEETQRSLLTKDLVCVYTPSSLPLEHRRADLNRPPFIDSHQLPSKRLTLTIPPGSHVNGRTGRINRKAALITGGASGIGLATAMRFVEEGARVTITDRDEPAGEAAEKAIGPGCRFLNQDVTHETRWDEIVADCVKTHGRLDILVNCAGIFRAGPIEHTTLEAWRETITINLEATFLGCRAAVRAMKREGGAIVNLCSVAGNIGEADYAAYDASKGGVRLLTKSVAVYCAREGYDIRCNSVHPGSIDTPMTQHMSRPDADREKHPARRIGRAEEVAALILFLASNDASYLNGTELIIDAGDSAGLGFSSRRS